MEHAKTKNNHYVPQKYLKNFLECGKLFCLDLKKRETTEIKNFSKKAYVPNLYTVNRFDDFNSMSPECRNAANLFLQMLIERNESRLKKWLFCCFVAFMYDFMGECLNLELKNADCVKESLKKELRDFMNGNKPKSRNLELAASVYESDALMIISDITINKKLPKFGNKTCELYEFYLSDFFYNVLAKNMITHANLKNKEMDKNADRIKIQDANDMYSHTFAWTQQDKDYAILLRYLMFQHMRTPLFQNIVNTIIKNHKYNHCIDSKSFWLFYAFYEVMYVCKQLAVNNYRFILVENVSKIPFITSDYPVIPDAITTCAEDYIDYSYYLPLSPQLCLLCTNDESVLECKLIKYNEADVEAFNTKIVRYAEQYVFSSDKSLLDKLKA